MQTSQSALICRQSSQLKVIQEEKDDLHDPKEQSNRVGDEINEIRKLVVEMMHSEMEMIAHIEQYEGNAQDIDKKIKHFKDLIEEDKKAEKNLLQLLAEDKKELELVKEKKIVAEAKFRELQEIARSREAKVKEVCEQYQKLHIQHQAFKMSRMHAQAHLNKITAEEKKIIDLMQQKAPVKEASELDDLRQTLQTIRAKKKYVYEHSTQMGSEADALSTTRADLHDELDSSTSKIQHLRSEIRLKEKETEIIRARVLQEIEDLKRENERANTKLKTKRSKLLFLLKNEHETLRKRIQYVLTELEQQVMKNEDTASTISFVFNSKQNVLKERLRDTREDITNAEGKIHEMASKLKILFEEDESDMQSRVDLSKSQIDVENRKQILAQLQDQLQQERNEYENAKLEHEEIMSEVNTLKSHENDLLLQKDKEKPEATISNLQAQQDEIRRNRTLLEEEVEATCQRIKHLEEVLQPQIKKEQLSLMEQLSDGYNRLEDSCHKEKQVKLALQEMSTNEKLLIQILEHGKKLSEKFNSEKDMLQTRKKELERKAKAQEDEWKVSALEEEMKLQEIAKKWQKELDMLQRQLSTLPQIAS